MSCNAMPCHCSLSSAPACLNPTAPAPHRKTHRHHYSLPPHQLEPRCQHRIPRCVVHGSCFGARRRQGPQLQCMVLLGPAGRATERSGIIKGYAIARRMHASRLCTKLTQRYCHKQPVPSHPNPTPRAPELRHRYKVQALEAAVQRQRLQRLRVAGRVHTHRLVPPAAGGAGRQSASR